MGAKCSTTLFLLNTITHIIRQLELFNHLSDTAQKCKGPKPLLSMQFILTLYLTNSFTEASVPVVDYYHGHGHP